MGMKSEPFRGVVLSGDDIKKFDAQVRKHRAGKAAVATVSRGTKLAAQLQKKGYVIYKPKGRAKVG